MAFVVNSIINSIRFQGESQAEFHTSDKVALMIDVAIVVGAFVAAIGPLIFAGVLSPYTIAIAPTFAGLGLLVLFTNVCVGGVRTALRPPRRLPTREFFISQSETLNPTHKERTTSSQVPYHQILEGLYLGQARGCLNAAFGTQMDESVQFDTILSVCPIHHICDPKQPLPRKSTSHYKTQLSTGFKDRDVLWLNVGSTLRGQSGNFKVLAHDCTFPNGDLSKDFSTKRWTALNNQKTNRISKIKVEYWFAPVFKEIDDAVSGRKNLLVHCQLGVSRSSTLLAAYLIHRYQMTPQKAIAFLKTKRPCVKSKFMDELEEYYNTLYPSQINEENL